MHFGQARQDPLLSTSRGPWGVAGERWRVLTPRAQGDAKGKSLTSKPTRSCEAPQPREWTLEQLTRLYHRQEEETPELEIDMDQLRDMQGNDIWAARAKELMVGCYKPTETFISVLLDKIQGLQKPSTPQQE